MKNLKRITFDPNVMGGKPTIRGLRATVGMIIGLIAAGHDNKDIHEALTYDAWRVEEIELPLVAA
jgi:uncharacterized protein (DUF433 family)